MWLLGLVLTSGTHAGATLPSNVSNCLNEMQKYCANMEMGFRTRGPESDLQGGYLVYGICTINIPGQGTIDSIYYSACRYQLENSIFPEPAPVNSDYPAQSCGSIINIDSRSVGEQ